MSRLYNDSVHGHIHLDDYLFDWIDTPEFQRLRRIKQLGVASWVFEGATHTRFGHSIGVAYLANKMIKSIKFRLFPDVTDEMIENITLAGLLHDIGHGPFSHLFEDFINEKTNKKFSHEEMSCRIIEFMWYNYSRIGNRYKFERIQFIQSLILGKMPKNYPNPWHYEIVSNPSTSIDVDKFDYFQRDTKYANIQMTYNPSRFFDNFNIIDGHICYYEKELHNIYELYHTRYILFKTVYYHKTVCVIEEMVKEILSQNPKIMNIIDNVVSFMELTDDVLFERENSILNNLQERKLWNVLWEGVFHPSKDRSFEKITNEHLHGVIISKKKVNFTKNEENPLNYVRFCRDGKSFVIDDVQDKLLMANNFEEVCVRLISPEKELNKEGRWFLMENNIEEGNIHYR